MVRKPIKCCKVYFNGVFIGIADIELPEPATAVILPIALIENIAKGFEELERARYHGKN